jgi:hypothetical protein
MAPPDRFLETAAAVLLLAILRAMPRQTPTTLETPPRAVNSRAPSRRRRKRRLVQAEGPTALAPRFKQETDQ